MRLKNLTTLLILFTSCRTVHKTSATTILKKDSATTIATDTSFVSKSRDFFNDLSIYDLHIKINYDSLNDTAINKADTIRPKYQEVNWKEFWLNKKHKTNEGANNLKWIISNSGMAGRISSIELYADSIKVKNEEKSGYDSFGGRKIVKTDIRTTDQKTVITTDKKPISLLVPALWILGILLILFFIFQLAKRYFKF